MLFTLLARHCLHTGTPQEDLAITVNEVDSTSQEILRTNVGSGKCMYVRREIRSLSDDDLSAGNHARG